MLNEDLIRSLVCPDTRQPVAPAPPGIVSALNDRIRQGAVRDASGRTLEHPIEAGLLREDGRVLYPVIDGIPHMLIERGIPLIERGIPLIERGIPVEPDKAGGA